MAIEIVDFPIKNCDFPLLFVCSPEGNGKTPLFDDQTHCPWFDVLTQMVLMLFVDEPPFFSILSGFTNSIPIFHDDPPAN